MAAPLERVELVSVAQYIKKEEDGNDAETWRVVLNSADETPAYLKLTDNPHHTLAELVSSQIGRALKLPIPKPYIALVHETDLPESSKYAGTSPNTRYAFACAQFGKNPMNCSRKYNQNNSAFAKILADWQGLNNARSFDEYIANEDRNLGNLIYSPESKEIGLIDHGRSLTGSYWPVWGLSDAQRTVNNNLLANHQTLTINDKERLRAICNDLMQKVSKIDIASLDQDGHFQRLGGVAPKQEIVNFLTQRINFTVTLLCQRIGLPELNITTH